MPRALRDARPRPPALRAAILERPVPNRLPSPAGRHRADAAILASLAALDANNVGAKIRQQHAAIGPGNEAAKVENANSLEQSSHDANLFETMKPARRAHQEQRVGALARRAS